MGTKIEKIKDKQNANMTVALDQMKTQGTAYQKPEILTICN